MSIIIFAGVKIFRSAGGAEGGLFFGKRHVKSSEKPRAGGKGVIIYELRCRKGHKFEGWFKDREAFEKQKADRIIVCPVCKSTDAEVVPSSVAIMNRDSGSVAQKPAEAVSPLKSLKEFQEYIQKNFDNVGDKFAEVALRIHQGEEEGRNIRGTTTQSEEETLREEGVTFVKFPLPEYDA